MTSRKLWTVALFLFVAANGVATQVRGALLPSIERSFGVSESLLGFVAPASTAGYLVGALAVGFVVGRFDSRRLFLFSAGGTAVFLLMLSRVPTYTALLALLGGQGLAIGVFRGLDRPLLSSLYPEKRGRLFNLYGLTWAVGATVAPVFVNRVLTTSDWRTTFLVLALVFLPSLALVARLELPVAIDEGRTVTGDELRGLLKTPAVAIMALSLLLSGGIEGGFYTWLPYYAGQFFAPSTTNLTLSLFLLAFVPGRFAYSLLSESVHSLTLVIAMVGCSLPVFVYTFVFASGQAILAGVFCMGLFVSGFFPTLSAFGVDAVPDRSGPINAIAIGANFLGLSVVPVLMGFVSDWYSITIAVRLLAVVVAMLAVVALVARAAVYENRRFRRPN